MKPQIEIVADVKTNLGESPLWSVNEQRLYWVDILGRRIYRATEQGSEVRSWVTPSEVGCLAMRRRGGAVVGLQNGFHFLDLQNGDFEFISNPMKDVPENRFNDGKVDRQGRFVAGTMRQGNSQSGSAALYLLDLNLNVHELATGMDVVNGPCWNLPGDRFYFTDSERRKVFTAKYNLDDAQLRDVVTFLDDGAGLRGVPDGATIDEEGNYWQARAFAGEIVCVNPSGEIISRFLMPVKNITSLTFGGARMDTLFVTSMGTKNSEDQTLDPSISRGSVFAVRGIRARGVPEPAFLA